MAYCDFEVVPYREHPAKFVVARAGPRIVVESLILLTQPQVVILESHQEMG
jgi:hypothetical protein